MTRRTANHGSGHRLPPRPRAGGAFTLIELLVVVVIIGVIMSLVFVTTVNAVNRSRHVATARLLGSISVAIETFHADHDYYPPLLNENEESEDWDGVNRLIVADGSGLSPGALLENDESPTNPYKAGAIEGEREFNNIYSPAIYLLGLGDINGDSEEQYDDPDTPEVDPNLDDGVDGPGLRSPGPDRSWGGARDRSLHRPVTTGRTYGPYMDAGSADLVERVNDDESGHLGLYNFIDRWGNPIRYYRSWPKRNADDEDRNSMFYVPYEVRTESEMRALIERINPGGQSLTAAERTLAPELYGAPYVLLSIGVDALSGHITPAADGMPPDLDSLDWTNLDETPSAVGTWKDMLEAISDNVRHIP